ncbi:HCc2 [Symbiodinium necroappetens]|uniref:HCc2 protein n=1 Tax=Symbiodinium necroappetens TaxID=1628268 RepID=A0A813BY93_9DINO|nr:HCc2 [Symbiodinium necroappetens]
MIPPLPTPGMWQVKPSPRVDVPFPELPSDADTDWRLRLGPSVFDIHKAGAKGSAGLHNRPATRDWAGAYGAFDGMYDESGGGTVTPCISHADVIEAKESGCGRIFETDLSHILPEQVWPFFSQALDFIYSEDLVLNEENAVPLLRCAESLARSVEPWCQLSCSAHAEARFV